MTPKGFATLALTHRNEENVPSVGERVLAFLKDHAAKSVIVADGIIGCPHEEGIDYPEGKSCPQCPYWAGRDRFTLEHIQ